jgi:hypothetical protein
LSGPIAEQWRQHFVAYERALASFYSLQEATHRTLEQSHAITSQLDRLGVLRAAILEARRRLPASADGGRVAEIERERATLDIDGVLFPVMDLVANRAPTNGTVLELGFRVDPKSIPQFMKLNGSVRITFPFGASVFVAACRLVRFRLIRDEFAFRFATVDPDSA